jgi:hypothetical protein
MRSRGQLLPLLPSRKWSHCRPQALPRATADHLLAEQFEFVPQWAGEWLYAHHPTSGNRRPQAILIRSNSLSNWFADGECEALATVPKRKGFSTFAS